MNRMGDKPRLFSARASAGEGQRDAEAMPSVQAEGNRESSSCMVKYTNIQIYNLRFNECII